MKNLNDIFSGAVLLCLCAVGAYEVSASIAPSDGEVVGADALPTLALGGMALCGVFLILQGLLRSRPAVVGETDPPSSRPFSFSVSSSCTCPA